MTSTIKRVFDFTVAVIALIILSPMILVVACLIAVSMGRPVLFRQVRAGLHGAPFTILKFRTMRNTRSATGELLPDAERKTALGTWLRRFSFDELPQLVNVIRGDLSLVGPRPLFIEYIPLYSAAQRRRLLVKPGITGWAQVQGRNALTWEEKFELDIWYVDHHSILLDVKILALTVLRVAQGSAIEGYGNIPFGGSGKESTTLHHPQCR